MEFAITNPFVPRYVVCCQNICRDASNHLHSASIIRFPNGVFEMRIHTHGICSAVEVVPHDNYVLVTGRMIPRARRDFFGHPSALVWSDNSCGYFSRDIPIRLSPGTRVRGAIKSQGGPQLKSNSPDCDFGASSRLR